MNIPSAAPRSTTFVSPVTISTRADRAARAMSPTTRLSVSSGNPSSRMKPALSHRGRAPHIARSFTVPFTARSPIEPPGKNNGRTT